ncbi:OBAP family protein [Pseudomonas plecoglossicida]|uniref:OBAP family protein n=1 Tax=Pseudomonas plecoglossicida TaxID=70775 RepID=UPI0015E3FD06|nr:OBAP family protein [Pseudomonas plecoglossicida]MBA1196263.1 OBAP family protein [Pseudomonas plecoglossicida]
MRQPLQLISLSIACGALWACSAADTHSPVETPGRPESAKTQVLEAGAATLQAKPPIEAINAYLDGFHFYNGHPDVQMEAHHYCSILNEDVIQCVIFDGNTKQAKIMGVEYIIDEKLFAGLPAKEKAMWHSHGFEVSSGQLIAPGIPQLAEHALMQRLAHTYGKTWHTWHTDQDKALPVGVPQLMMGFTADGQADPKMVEQRNQHLGVDSAKTRAQRADIKIPPADAAADGWQHGNVIQLEDPTGEHLHHPAKATPPASNSRSSQ